MPKEVFEYHWWKLRLSRLREAGEALDLSGYICHLVCESNPSGSSMKEYIVNGWTHEGYDGILFVKCENAPVDDTTRGFFWSATTEEEMRAYCDSLHAIRTH